MRPANNATNLWGNAPSTPGIFAFQRNGPSETECAERFACVFRTGQKQAGDSDQFLTETGLAMSKRVLEMSESEYCDLLPQQSGAAWLKK